MTAQLKSGFHISLEKVPRISSVAVFLVGCIVLAGWQFDLPVLTSLLPGTATMKANSAVGFILCGISLWLLSYKQAKKPTHLLANVCAAFVFLMAVLTLGEYVSNRDFGIDQLLFQDTTSGTSFPGRMSHPTALNFLLITTSLLLIDNRRSTWLNQSLTITALIIAGVVVIGYIYGVSSLYQIGIYASMALHTALAFILLSLGILSARPERGLIRIFTDEGAAGMLARRLLPAAIAIPIVLGLLGLTGQRMGLYDNAFGIALFALANILVFSALIWWNAHMLQWADVERREAEKALRQAELRSWALIENSQDGIALFAADGTILYGSPSTIQILGYPLEEFVGRNAFELIHEADHAAVTERLTLSLQQPGAHVSVRARVRHKDGEWRWLDGIFTNLLDEPSIQAIVNNYQDITEQKRDEDALHASESRNTAIIESSLDALITMDHQGRILEFNPAAEAVFGYTRSETIGKEMAELIIPPSLREQHRRGLAHYLSTGEEKVLEKRIELTGMRADGTEFPVELTITCIKGEESPVFTGFLRDITELKRMEETRNELAAIVESSDEAIIGKTLDGIITSWNRGAERVYGYVAAEVVGRPISILIPPDLPEELPAILNQIRMGRSINHYETARLRKDGQRINVSLTVSPIRDSAGNISGASTIARDISARKQAEEKIAYQAYLLENVNDAVIGSDENSYIRFWNQGAERMLGWKAEEVLGHSGREILRSEFLNADRETVLKILAEQGRWKGEATLYRKDGSQVIMEVSSITLRDANGQITGYVSVNRDIAERKQAEANLYKSEELLRLGYDTAKLGIWQNNLVTGMVHFDERARAQYGFDADNVPLADVIARVHPDDVDRLGQEIAKTTEPASDGRYGTEYRVIHPDGSVHWLAVQAHVYFQGEGNSRRPVTGFGTSQDITEHKNAEEHWQANTARAVLIAELSQAFAQLTNDYQGLLGLAARRIAELIGDYCAICLVGADDVSLQLIVDHHLDASAQEFMHQLISSIPQRTDEGITAQVFRSGKAVLLPFVSPDAFRAQAKSEFHPILERLNIHSILVAPLRAEGKIIGTITMSRDQTPHAYTKDDQIFLQDLADRAALAIVSARLYTATQQLNAKLEQRVVQRTAALSQANALLQMLLDYMPDHIYFKDAQSRFIRNSRSQAKALGLSDPAEAVGKSDFDFFPHAQLSYEKEQEIMQSGKPLMDLEERVVWPDGRETWVSTTKMPLLDYEGQIMGTFGISRDITGRKRAEAALQKAKLELESANKELEAFSYSVSHDLRSPLRSIDGFSQALLEDYGELLPPEGRNFLERVRSSAQRMAELIDDLLNLSKVTRASMKLVPVDLSQLAQGIAAELQRNHSERNVRLTIAKNLKAHGDPNLLRIVLENLINNAWKFTSKQQLAEIEVGSKRENNETIYFIRDNGAGFDMAYASKLFGAFQRLHSMAEFSGTGIGLATVQRIINRHGGRVWAEGAVDQGATFFFSLPALERAKPEAVPKEKDSLTKRIKEII